MDLELTGKTVLVTGGTDGLGLALATQLAAEGAAVGVCGRDQERLRNAEETVQAVGGDVLAQRADVSRAEDLEAFVEAAVTRWGRIDGVVHNAGRASGGSIETIFNPVAAVEIAVEKGAASILMPISSRRQLNDLSDDVAAKITIHYYLDARDALLKALAI